eukprot:TRINITY_DN14111_c0_g2_i1.p1 TRINITY_DN14111_c0_g2~~TRINITY_DN14111_c0_g2_i1.p1  ORF type:complete len:431 (+),score=71.97 TRINITY_DN14111_c0_g2_i1:399-1691(+)
MPAKPHSVQAPSPLPGRRFYVQQPAIDEDLILPPLFSLQFATICIIYLQYINQCTVLSQPRLSKRRSKTHMPKIIKKEYFPISPLILRPDFRGPFDIYLRHDDNYVLFNAQGRLLSKAKRDELAATDITSVYIDKDSLKRYNAYLRENLMAVLNDDNIPLDHRAHAWSNAAAALAKELFEINLPGPAFKKRYHRFEELIRSSSEFVQSPLSLKNITRFINKGYDIYQHGVSTMVYAVNLIQEYDFEDSDNLACGMGALLHDIGKVGLPERIASADPAGLPPDEQATLSMHPMIGVRNCANFNLPVIATNCILFHHERADGKGYPTQAALSEIPLPTRIVCLCDSYDNLTRNRPYKRALKPFDALKELTDDKGLVEPDMLKRFIGLLSKAEIVQTELRPAEIIPETPCRPPPIHGSRSTCSTSPHRISNSI